MLPLTCSTRNSNWLLIELMFKCAKTNLCKLLLLTDFKSLTQSLDFWLAKDVSELRFSVEIPGILRVLCQLTILHISLVNPGTFLVQLLSTFIKMFYSI